jgi:hypothetical protein
VRPTGLTDQTIRQNNVIFVAGSKVRIPKGKGKGIAKHTFVAGSKVRMQTKVREKIIYTKRLLSRRE